MLSVICTSQCTSQCCSIDEFKICAIVQVKSEDLRVFVEVLQTLNSEPTDMLQLRSSEAQLRNKVAKLQAEADGYNLQQTVKQLQQAEVNYKCCLHPPHCCSPMPVASILAAHKQVSFARKALSAVVAYPNALVQLHPTHSGNSCLLPALVILSYHGVSKPSGHKSLA